MVSFNSILTQIRSHLNSPFKILVFSSMILWAVGIRVFLILLPVEKLVTLVYPKRLQVNTKKDDVLRYVHWLKRLRIIRVEGDCLALSLLSFRYLLAAGEMPELYIGIKDNSGHAWVEVSGHIISESDTVSKNFSPVLVLRAGSSNFTPAK